MLAPIEVYVTSRAIKSGFHSRSDAVALLRNSPRISEPLKPEYCRPSAISANVSPSIGVGKPVFIRRRTEEEIEAARAVELGELIDTSSQNPNLAGTDASDANRAMDEAGEWLVMSGVCTHLGCVPIGDGAGDFGGWFCPCHGSHYDTSGRIRRGPAPQNLHIPVAEFVDESTIKLG